MSTSTTTTTPYLLVSDSNEVGSQMDSKKLDQAELSEMAQNELFNMGLTILNNYVTKSQYSTYKSMLNNSLDEVQNMYNAVKDSEWSGKLQAVDGQVILLHQAQIGNTTNPIEYIKKYWYIPIGYTITQIKNCMLRGVTDIDGEDIKCSSQTSVSLSSDNFPAHMHHSGITQNSGVQSAIENTSSTKVSAPTTSRRYDLFHNDALTTGLSRNELDGVGDDDFTVQNFGDGVTVSHNNLPNYDKYYAFMIRKTG